MSNEVVRTLSETIIQTWYIWSLILIVLLLKLMTPMLKGIAGEQAVRVVLRALNPKEFSIIHNVIIATNDRLTQIDHIVIAKSGIYVIETKNYKGLITGSETSATWTQHLYKKKISFYNPIRQNNSHITALSSVLHLPETYFTSLVAFSPEAKLRVDVKTSVLYYSGLVKAIRSSSSESLCAEEKDRIAGQIKELKFKNKRLHKEQIMHARKQRT